MTTANEVSKTRLFFALMALFLSSMCTLGDLVITPVVAVWYEVFADYPVGLINMCVTGPSLVGLPCGIIAGILCDRFDKKIVMVVGFAIFTLSSVFGAAFDNFYYVLTMRQFATGVGWGITNTTALSILADLFTDENEHGKYVGWYNATMSLLGALLAYAGGVLAVSAWQNAYLAYIPAIPVLIMLIIFLPSFPPHKKEEDEAASANDEDRSATGWWKRIIPLTIQVFFVALFYFVLLYMLAVYVTDAGAGDEAFIGLLTSVMTIASAIGSFVFGKAYEHMKNAVYLPALFIMGICFLVQAFFPSPIPIMISCAVAGFFWPFYFVFFYTRVAELVPPSKVGKATSIVAFSDGLACLMCSYLLTGLMEMTGGTSVDVWPVFGIGLIVLGVISCIWYFIFNKKDKSPQAVE